MLIGVQIDLHLRLAWPADAAPEGVVVPADGSPARAFSGRLELLAVLEELCLTPPPPPGRS
jgi:hypothetical protein